MKKKIHLHLVISEELANGLKSIKEKTGLSTTVIIRKAIVFYIKNKDWSAYDE